MALVSCPAMGPICVDAIHHAGSTIVPLTGLSGWVCHPRVGKCYGGEKHRCTPTQHTLAMSKFPPNALGLQADSVYWCRSPHSNEKVQLKEFDWQAASWQTARSISACPPLPRAFTVGCRQQGGQAGHPPGERPPGRRHVPRTRLPAAGQRWPMQHALAPAFAGCQLDSLGCVVSIVML